MKSATYLRVRSLSDFPKVVSACGFESYASTIY